VIELLYAALHSQRGIKVASSDRLFLRQKLYEARAELADPDLKMLSIVESPINPDHLWIVRKHEKEI
jgi:hypothetical protein